VVSFGKAYRLVWRCELYMVAKGGLTREFSMHDGAVESTGIVVADFTH